MSQMYGNALDMMYLQLITLIEIVSDAGILTPEKWEEKLESVSKSMEERIKEKIDDQPRVDGQDNVNDPDGTNAPEGSKKIITPNSGIIIPG